MKFATASLASTREGTRERHRRGRMSATAMRTRYPALSSLRLSFKFSDDTSFLPSPQVTVFHPPAPAYFCFPCPYSDCNGEFNLTKQVDLAVSSRETECSDHVICGGARHRGDTCKLRLDYSISPDFVTT